ncbi:MAG TPA: N-acetylmannosamine-6-phosphate 2-epimerase [bacterium]|nr:N-acetylmannosamine-6-phosphate 2-epimerase [bacterium]
MIHTGFWLLLIEKEGLPILPLQPMLVFAPHKAKAALADQATKNNAFATHDKKVRVLPMDIDSMRGGLIVSVQADEGLPMAVPEILAAVAETVALAHPAGLRASLPENIRAIKKAVSLPVIGIYKKSYSDSPVIITPTRADAREVIESGAEIIALDATFRPRPRGEAIADVLAFVRDNSDCLVMADIATFAEGMEAARMGFDWIGTTLSGYTEATTQHAQDNEPDYALIAALAGELPQEIRLIAEGRIWDPAQAVRAIQLGAFAVVVGTAITRPNLITRRFVQRLQQGKG